MSLDFEPNHLKKLIEQAVSDLFQLYGRLEDQRVFCGCEPDEVRSLFEEPLPLRPTDPETLLERVSEKIYRTATLNIGPNFYGYITGGGNQIAMVAELIKAGLNQNNLKWHSSPVSTELERIVCRWIAEFVGYPVDSSGILLGGGSVANFESLAVARKMRSPKDVSAEGLYDSPPLTVYVSEEGHSSFDKAVDMLGIGTRQLRRIRVDREFRIDPEALESAIRKDREEGYHPLAAIAIAGTTNTGAIDDLEAVAGICAQYGLWYHIDAAYGGPAARLEELRPLFRGIERADSLVVNPHKWMYVPFGAAAVLIKRREDQRQTFSLVPDYLRSDEEGRDDLMEYNLPLTKEFRALKVWLTVKTFGADALRECVRLDIEKARHLVDLIRKNRSFELLASSPLSIVCFRYVREGISEQGLDLLNRRLLRRLEKDGRVFLTGTRIRARTALRACVINHRSRREHMNRLLEVIQQVAREIPSR